LLDIYKYIFLGKTCATRFTETVGFNLGRGFHYILTAKFTNFKKNNVKFLRFTETVGFNLTDSIIIKSHCA
jgi:hypothetical protein